MDRVLEAMHQFGDLKSIKLKSYVDVYKVTPILDQLLFFHDSNNFRLHTKSLV